MVALGRLGLELTCTLAITVSSALRVVAEAGCPSKEGSVVSARIQLRYYEAYSISLVAVTVPQLVVCPMLSLNLEVLSGGSTAGSRSP